MTSLYNFTQEDLKKLLANRFVVLIGDSVMRTIYKDLVVMLQYGRRLTNGECRSKGEATLNNDVLLEGGRMTNGKDYREVRQFVHPQYLIRFYFITRVYNGYVETIFADFYKSLKPDIVIVNSCLWDISRYGVKSMESYKVNLQKFCCNLKRLLSSQVAVIWTTTLPVSSQIRGGFLSHGTGFLTEILRLDVLVANNFSFQVAKRFGFGVLDLNFLFRQKLHLMAKDGVHWMSEAHRDITNILMAYICRAFNVVVPNRCRTDRLLRFPQPTYSESLMSFEEPNEVEMSYCEGLYNETPDNDDNSYVDNNWIGNSFDEANLVGWPKRNYISPDRNANWLQRNIGKWQNGPESSSTPILSHVRRRHTDQYATDNLSQSFNKSSRNGDRNSSNHYRCSSNQNTESGNKWAEDCYISFDESPDEESEVEVHRQVMVSKEHFYNGNQVNWSENSYSNFKKNWMPYQADEMVQTQKSSMQNFNRGKHAFAKSYSDVRNERSVQRSHQPYQHHYSSKQRKGLCRVIHQLQRVVKNQNFDHTFQGPTYHHRSRPY